MKKNAQRPAVEALSLDGELNIYRANDVKAALVAALEAPEPITIDVSKVTEIDSAGIQLLLAAKKGALAKEKTLRFVNHSPALVGAMKLLNVCALLDGNGAST